MVGRSYGNKVGKGLRRVLGTEKPHLANVYGDDEDEENAESEAVSASRAQSHSAERGSAAGGNGFKISVA